MESPYYEMTHDFEEENRLFQSGYVKGYHDAVMKCPDIVRCKDCRWGDWSRNGKGEEMIFCYNGDTGIEDGYLHEPDWFCAEGERRTDDA